MVPLPIIVTNQFTLTALIRGVPTREAWLRTFKTLKGAKIAASHMLNTGYYTVISVTNPDGKIVMKKQRLHNGIVITHDLEG
jgi:hypothetical protein